MKKEEKSKNEKEDYLVMKIFIIIFILYALMTIMVMDGVGIMFFIMIPINTIFIILCISSFLCINKIYKNKFKEVREYEYYRNLDIKEITAVASGILTKKVKIDINTIITALYELSEKNIVEIKWENETKKNILKLKEHDKTKINELLPYEKSIIKFIFNSPKDNNEYCLENILKEVENNATKRYILKEIEKEIKDYINKKYYDNITDFSKNLQNLMWVKLGSLLCIIILIFNALPTISILVTIGFSSWIYSIVIIEYFINLLLVIYYSKYKFIKSKYHDEVQKIYGLYAYMSDYSLLKEQELKFYQLYNTYYVYAMGLGLADKFEKELNQQKLDNNVRTAIQFYMQNKEDL